MNYQTQINTHLRTFYRLCLISILAASLGACLSTQDSLFPTMSVAEKNAPELPINLVMDVGIEEFDENYTLEEAKDREVFAEVRKAEAKYFALRLKRAVEKTGYWNGVWVVPEAAVADIKVRGKILESDGQELKLHIIAVDATGKELLDKKYSEEATEYDYSAGRKPFDVTFNEIAEDLKKSIKKKDHAHIQSVKNSANLRFANWIAPDAFSHHLDKKHKIASLPADNDPIYLQAIRLREHDALFFDKLQDYYDDFYGKVESHHTNWAKESYLEIEAKQGEQINAVTEGLLGTLLTVGGIAAMAAGMDSAMDADPNVMGATAGIAGGALAAAGGVGVLGDAVDSYQKSKVHDEAIRELGASVETTLRPHTIEVEGKTVSLEGSIDQQYLQWHSVLQEQYYAETQNYAETQDQHKI